MLAVPFVVGATAAGWRWLHLTLLLGWVVGYLFAQALGQWLKSRRKARYREPVLVYGAVLVPLAAIVVLAAPRLLWFAPAYLPLVALNLWFAWRRAERELVNDLVAVAEASLMVVVAYVAGGGGALATRAWLLCLVVGLYFAGTVPYVKTMIRERGHIGYYRASVGFHVVALVLATLVSWWLAVPFVLLLARAALLPRHRLRPLTVGLVEIANSALVAAVVLLAV